MPEPIKTNAPRKRRLQLMPTWLFSSHDRIGRLSYQAAQWQFYLITIGTVMLLMLFAYLYLTHLPKNPSVETGIVVYGFILVLFLFVPIMIFYMFILSVGRLQDMNRSGKWMYVPVLLIGAGMLFGRFHLFAQITWICAILCCLYIALAPGTKGYNHYGAERPTRYNERILGWIGSACSLSLAIFLLSFKFMLTPVVGLGLLNWLFAPYMHSPTPHTGPHVITPAAGVVLKAAPDECTLDFGNGVQLHVPNTLTIDCDHGKKLIVSDQPFILSFYMRYPSMQIMPDADDVPDRREKFQIYVNGFYQNPTNSSDIGFSPSSQIQNIIDNNGGVKYTLSDYAGLFHVTPNKRLKPAATAKAGLASGDFANDMKDENQIFAGCGEPKGLPDEICQVDVYNTRTHFQYEMEIPVNEMDRTIEIVKAMANIVDGWQK